MKVHQQIKVIVSILIGLTLYAVAVVAFVIPNKLITGGTTGIALFFNYKFAFSIPVFIFIFNTLMLLMGGYFMGKSFMVSTLISTFYCPFILSVVEKIPWLQGLTDNPLLAAIYAGGMIGVGLGIVLKAGASTGGMDIPPILINKKFGISIASSMTVFDCLILVLQMVNCTIEQILYGILLVIIYTTVIDKVMIFGKSQMQVKVISKQYDEINAAIQKHLDRGSTLLKAVSGYRHDEQYVVLAVISNRELPKLNKIVLEVDSHAFIIINQVNEVRGRGFTLEKKME